MECHANLIVTVNNLHNSVSDDTNFGKQLRIPKDICMFRTALSQSIALSRTALRLAERCLALSSWKLSINTLHQQLFCLQEEPSFLYNLSEESILFLKPSFKYDPMNSYPYEQQLSHYNLLDLACTRVEWFLKKKIGHLPNCVRIPIPKFHFLLLLF